MATVSIPKQKFFDAIQTLRPVFINWLKGHVGFRGLEADDLLSDFTVYMLDHGYFARYDPKRGANIRTFVYNYAAFFLRKVAERRDRYVTREAGHMARLANATDAGASPDHVESIANADEARVQVKRIRDELAGRFEQRCIDAFIAMDGNRKKAAKLIGVPRSALNVGISRIQAAVLAAANQS